MAVPADVIAKIEAGYKKLQEAPECKSLLKKYLTKKVMDQCKGLKTELGATLLDVIQSGVANLDSGVGVYAPDAESYKKFAALFDPIINDYHGGFGPSAKHPATYFGEDKLSELQDLDPEGKYILSTRYPFNPCLSKDDYLSMQSKIQNVFAGLKSDSELGGTYYPLERMTKETQNKLIANHFLFKEGDRFLKEANANRFWPTGRGIFHNAKKTFVVWVNEEDHLRIISMQNGGNVGQVLGRLINGVKAIEAQVPFSRDDRLGYLTFCPSNLDMKLQIRGIHGEHSETKGGVYDISNKARLGLTEYDAVKQMYDGVKKLIELEKAV
ncbi:hypothetical protein Mgra_00010236 [Meloidogyne graminicola]|uniref:arginine kinase n=1 Tax=Meloidogyne graminicola TaxID=189291 RepID=A0A8S9ZAR0_9BILA|nr:hypothetical protein Mgra_00010236 [Meloidogyne graminicola]